MLLVAGVVLCSGTRPFWGQDSAPTGTTAGTKAKDSLACLAGRDADLSQQDNLGSTVSHNSGRAGG